MRKRLKLLLRQGVAASTALGMIAMQADSAGAYGFGDPNAFPTTTPIKHVVVIFGENISFDHYFGTRSDQRPRDGLLRRQYRHRALELRPELRD